MSLFCLLCIPLIYLLRTPSRGGQNIWALPLGAAAVVLGALFGPPAAASGFGLSRWLNGFVSVVGLPALIPLIVCGALVILRVFPRDSVDYAGFALLWLVPLAAIRSISASPPAPIPLIVVPLLWAAQAIGIPFFIDMMTRNQRPHIQFCAGIGIISLPIAAVTAWWAFFSQQTLLGFALLVVCLVPTAVSLCTDLMPQPMDYTDILSRDWGTGTGD